MAGHPHGRPMMRQPGEKTDFKSMKKMLVYCKRYMPAVIVAVILAIGGSYATIIGPEYISDLTNEIIAGMMMEINMSAVRDIAVKLLVIYIAGALLSYGQQFITATVTQHAARRLRNDIDGKINGQPSRSHCAFGRGNDKNVRVERDTFACNDRGRHARFFQYGLYHEKVPEIFQPQAGGPRYP